MNMLAVAAAALLNGIIRSECSSGASAVEAPSHWYPSLIGSLNLPLPASQCPGPLRVGYFGGSAYNSNKAVMTELRILSDTEAAITWFFKNSIQHVFIDIPRVAYTLSQMAISANAPPVCVLQFDKIKRSGTRVRFLPWEINSTESPDLLELVPELGEASEDQRIGVLIASDNLVYGIVPMQRITTKIVDWDSFLLEELKPMGITDLPPSVYELISQRAVPQAKSGAHAYTGSRAFLAATILIAFKSLYEREK